jgi:DNA-binding GntR family transcriptional regulator
MRGDLEATSRAMADGSGETGAVTRHSFAERIYAQLRLALMSGLYEPGSRLNIRHLAAAYQTSQTPVREAIIQLVADGALELKLGHQPKVPVLTIPGYLEIRETRVPLERLAAELAAANMARRDIAELQSHQSDFLRSEEEQDWKRALSANQSFHFAIYRKSNNGVLVRMIENLWLLAGPFVSNQYPLSKRLAFDIHPHEKIIDALKRRDAASAGEFVVSDLLDGSQRILDKIKSESRRGGKSRKNT